MSRYAARWILSVAYLLHRPQETVHIGSLRARPSILRAVIAYLAPSLCRKLPALRIGTRSVMLAHTLIPEVTSLISTACARCPSHLPC